jgi:hypothetical protein
MYMPVAVKMPTNTALKVTLTYHAVSSGAMAP